MACPEQSKFTENIPDPDNESLCEVLKKVSNFYAAFADQVQCEYNEDGSISDELKQKICDTGCGGGGSGGSTTTTDAGPAPTPSDDDIYFFASFLSGADVNTRLVKLDGSDFDDSETLNLSTVATLSSNRVVVAAALHPSSGDLYVLHTDGTSGASGSDLNVVLATCNKTTGALTDIADATIGGGNITLSPAGGQPITMDFRRNDNSLFVVHNGITLYTMDTGTGALTEVGGIKHPTDGVGQSLCNQLGFDHDSTMFTLTRSPSRSSNEMTVTDQTPDPLLLPSLYLHNYAVCGSALGAIGGFTSATFSDGNTFLIRANKIYVLANNTGHSTFFRLDKTPSTAQGSGVSCGATQVGSQQASLAVIKAVASLAT